MARQRITPGAFLELEIERAYYTYARILENASYAFYDLRSQIKVADLELIASRPVLFIVAVYDSAVNSGRWIKVGKIPLEEHFKVLPNKFIQDGLDPNRYNLYNPNTGEITETSRDNCIGLERAAIWEPEHVESRIKDYYDGISNVWVEQLRLT